MPSRVMNKNKKKIVYSLVHTRTRTRCNEYYNAAVLISICKCPRDVSFVFPYDDGSPVGGGGRGGTAKRSRRVFSAVPFFFFHTIRRNLRPSASVRCFNDRRRILFSFLPSFFPSTRSVSSENNRRDPGPSRNGRRSAAPPRHSSVRRSL